MKHEVLYGNLYADIAPWVDRGLKISERQMRDTINAIDRHRGKWDSWVTDTLTPITIIRGNVYLTLGPPKKDPTNYFWTVLQDLQTLARTHRLPDVELLLNGKALVVTDGAGGVPVDLELSHQLQREELQRERELVKLGTGLSEPWRGIKVDAELLEPGDDAERLKRVLLRRRRHVSEQQREATRGLR